MTTHVADRIEIADLFARLAHLLDDKRWHDAGTVYTTDVTVHSPRNDRLHGLDNVITHLRHSEVSGEHTQHLTTDLLVDLTGDHATTTAQSVVHFYRDGQPPHRTGGLRITSTAVRTPHGWRLHESRITLAWTR